MQEPGASMQSLLPLGHAQGHMQLPGHSQLP